jgi:D-3-phosphoglycerate dehydrogenase
MMKVLVVDDVHESLFSSLNQLEIDFLYQPQATLESIQEILPAIQGLVIRSKFKIDQNFFDSAKKLKFIARAGAGLDLIDLEAAENYKVKVFAANEGNKDALAEHVIGQLLMLSAKLKQADFDVRKGLWNREENRGWELEGKTIGIIGYGNMGKAVAKRLKAFGMRILAYDKYNKPTAFDASLDDIFELADIVSLHIPLTLETRNLVNPDFLNQFKKSIVLINSSRGEILSLENMLWGLQSGKLNGLISDVLPNEKLDTWTELEKSQFEQIKSYPNTLFSPHVAGWTFESYQKISEVLASKISDFILHELSE